MLFDKVITVCLNPSLDITMWINKFDLDEPVSTIREKVYPGGKSINVSRVLTSLNIPNRAISLVGTTNCHRLSGLLDTEGVSYSFIKADGEIRENLSIVMPNEKMLKINRTGFFADTDCVEQLISIIEHELSGITAPLLVFAGSLPKNITKQCYIQLVERFTKKNIHVAIDTDIFTKEDIMHIKPFIIKPNLVELSHLAGRELHNVEEVTEFARMLIPYVNHILVSMGGMGLVYLSKDETHIFKAPSVEVKSTVGAGDTTLAGFIASMFSGGSIAESVLYAGACGTASVILEGTGVITEQNVQSILDG